MSAPEPYPARGAALRLRGKVKPFARINRKVLLAGAAIGILGLFAAFSVALRPPKAAGRAAPDEIFAAAGRLTPDGLARLPVSYADADVPRLGAPLSGDLGAAMVAEERAHGLGPDWDVAPAEDFRPSEIDEAVRARRLAEAKLADTAAGAGLFFSLAAPAGGGARAAAPPPAAAATSDLLALAARAYASPSPLPGAGDANLQDRKRAFAAAAPEGEIYNPYAIETPVSPYQVMAGTMLPAALITGLNSDLPGNLTAQVTQPVYDSVTGTTLLIPQGARLIGRYQSDISFGQDRALIAWDRIVFPNGASLRIAEPGVDAAGASGLAGRTDNHWDRVFAAAGLATILAAGAGAGDSEEDGLERAVRRGFGDSVSRSGDRIVERSLAVQPTIRVAPGAPVHVLVTRDLVLAPYGRLAPT
ncbi:MAG: TrbI/VirB10 family protein [Pannonibacter sp.]